MSDEQLPYYSHAESSSRCRGSPSTLHQSDHFFEHRPRPMISAKLSIQLAFYSRDWVHQEILLTEPLSGCFDASRVSPKYNMSEAVYGLKKTEVQAGLQLKMGLDCYDLAGTIRSDGNTRIPDVHEPGDERTQYHTYWHVDLAAFGPRQEYMLKSYFATQNIHTSRLILWSNGDLSGNEILAGYVKRYPGAFALKIVDIPTLAIGTELEGSELLRRKDEKAWVDGDLICLLLLWNYSGVWVDMDSLLTRDLDPLLEHEFVTQWDCYDKAYQPFNGALMRFCQHSPYVCEAFHIMATGTAPLVGSIPPFKILPFCFSDGRSCRLDNRLPDPFVADDAKGKWTMGLGMEEGGPLDKALGNVFGLHLHNQWDKAFPKDGWVDRLLLQRYDRKLSS
ncbi:glycosyltransferase family 32 protein [Armillaria solidipes]|uniref:Glycosyltransferase family 32 protein n=1 Tax=Armillaria solidipes TaxID=1076256 RepID=A0A2H3C5M4_9AGAR|nr:glycosyltransferase family 32 protein [Armillaria solidipes]